MQLAACRPADDVALGCRDGSIEFGRRNGRGNKPSREFWSHAL